MAALISTVLLAIAQAMGAPLLQASSSTADAIRDVFRSPGGRQADNLKEDLNERDFWTGQHRQFDDSFRFLRHHGTDPLLSLDEDTLFDSRLAIEWITVEELVTQAARYSGTPVLLVGKVIDQRVISEDTFDRYGAEEFTVQGESKGYAAIVGLGGDLLPPELPSLESVAVVRGLVVASGRIRFPNGVVSDSAYFVATGEIDPTAAPPALQRLVRTLRSR